jgi:hypothetical protein
VVSRWAATADLTYIPAVRQCDDTDAKQSQRISDQGSNWSEEKQQRQPIDIALGKRARGVG